MAPKTVSIPYAFGRRDRVDPKLAPFGVLAVGQNVRLRKDGRLGVRHGFDPLEMTTANGTLSAFDLFEFRGRLCALGSDGGDSYPTDQFEYTGIEGEAWLGADRFGRRITVSPFASLREVAGIPQPDDGIEHFDAASGGGFVCLAYGTTGSESGVYALVVNAENDQSVLHERLGLWPDSSLPDAHTGPMRVVYAADTFFLAVEDGSIGVVRFTVGTDSRFVPTVTVGTTATVFDMCAVARATTAVFVLAYEQGGDLLIGAYDGDGVQIGSTITVPGLAVVHVAVEADQTRDRINVFTVETATTCRLRTFDFAGTLIAGPTSVQDGPSGSLCRLSSAGFAIAESVVVAVNTTAQNIVLTAFDQETHASNPHARVRRAVLRSRLIAAQSVGRPDGVAFAGWVAPLLPSDDQATNALFFATETVVHNVFRDYVRAADNGAFFNISYDPTTRELCWLAVMRPGVETVEVPVVSLVGFQSNGRRHGVNFGGLRYQAGATPTVYDGRFPAELGFGEAPGIIGITPSNDPAHDVVAEVTGDFLASLVLPTGGKSLTLTVTDGGVETLVHVPFVINYPPVAAAAIINFYGAGTVVASVVDARLHIVTVATGSDVSLSVTDGTAVEALGLSSVLGRVFIGSSGLTPGATYYYTVHFEVVLADKSLMLGPPSVGGASGDVFTRATSVTMGAGQNSNTIEVTTPHSVRVVLGDALFGGDVTAVLSRTEWQPVSGTAASTFRRCVSQRVPVGMTNYGAPLTITDTVSDELLGVREALYTQGSRGSLSGPLEQNAPQPCSLITATESRLITAGLGRESVAQVSREAFPSEVIAFSDFSPFLSQVGGPIVGVKNLDSVRLIFTSDRIYAMTGAGPDDLGGGAFDPPVEIPTPGGLETAWSFLEGPDGLWFQLDDFKLFRMPRGGGAPTWEGVDVEDTLRELSLIIGTAKHKRDNVGLFVCVAPNSDGGAAHFLVRDFRTEQWFEDVAFTTNDSVPGGHGVDAITSYGDTIAYCSGGVVYVQSADSFGDGGVGIYIDTVVRTHPLYPFGVGGYGQIYELLVTGEYRGDCRLELRVSYDDGVSYTALDTFELQTLTVGQTIQRKWTLPQDVTSSIVIEFAVTGFGAGTDNEGFIFNQVDLLVEAEAGLRELSPSEMA